MNTRRCFLPLRILIICVAAVGLTSQAVGQRLSDYSREPFVIEQLTRRVQFQNNGTATSVQTARIQINSDAGVRALGQLVFGYNSANERVEIAYVQVRKPDGQVLVAGSEAVQDLSGPVASVAPVYSDYRQKHVTVPGLRPGDTLEYSVLSMSQTPLALGQFWLSHIFARGAIVLDERLEVDIPRTRAIKLRCASGNDPTISDNADRRVYRWATSHRVRKAEEQSGSHEKNKALEVPEVQLTSFTSWEELGHWYTGLERDRRLLTAEARAKAAELTRGRKSDLEKLEAIYDYVAKNVRVTGAI